MVSVISTTSVTQLQVQFSWAARGSKHCNGFKEFAYNLLTAVTLCGCTDTHHVTADADGAIIRSDMSFKTRQALSLFATRYDSLCGRRRNDKEHKYRLRDKRGAALSKLGGGGDAITSVKLTTSFSYDTVRSVCTGRQKSLKCKLLHFIAVWNTGQRTTAQRGYQNATVVRSSGSGAEQNRR